MEPSEILSRAYSAWSSMAPLRARRERCKRYTYGDQWSDPVHDEKGKIVAEHVLIERTGKHPYTNNLIRQLVKTVVGRYRTTASELGLYGGEIRSIALDNALPELDARALEEFLISSCVVQRVVSERRWNGQGVWIDNIDLRRFFVNSFSDPRGWDIELIGMLHDMTMPELINRFAGGSPSRAAELRRIYGATEAPAITVETQGGGFFSSEGWNKCRVIEIWTFDARPLENNSTDSAFAWHCRYFAPDGTLLAEHDSPYSHSGHPFVVKFYPLTDGEVHSFVEDVLDQQKFINRLIVMLDHILACSAKGVLLYPIDQLPVDMSLDTVADIWAQADGVIPVTGRGVRMPEQVSSGGNNPGAYQLLQMQMRLFEQVSGVGSALMGRSNNARGADMLNAEVQAATTALADLFETFSSFTSSRNTKALCA